MRVIFYTIAVLVGSVGLNGRSALAEESASRVQEIIICKGPGNNATTAAVSGQLSIGRTVRTLRIYGTKEKTDGGATIDGCRATYTKTSVEQTVGASRQIQQCQSIIQGIQKNLEASNWSCRRAGPMAILRSNAAEASEAMIDARAPVKEESVVR